jgi:hypothetical protein
MIVVDKFFEEGVIMGDNAFNDGGWYPHDGEEKGMCTGSGCDCHFMDSSINVACIVCRQDWIVGEKSISVLLRRCG